MVHAARYRTAMLVLHISTRFHADFALGTVTRGACSAGQPWSRACTYRHPSSWLERMLVLYSHAASLVWAVYIHLAKRN